jgi:NAD(P)-dependent dehydrogenase (short-subunit alcohol dehydrogenase family)
MGHTLDVTDTDAVRRVVNQALTELDRIDVILNNVMAYPAQPRN